MEHRQDNEIELEKVSDLTPRGMHTVINNNHNNNNNNNPTHTGLTPRAGYSPPKDFSQRKFTGGFFVIMVSGYERDLKAMLQNASSANKLEKKLMEKSSVKEKAFVEIVNIIEKDFKIELKSTTFTTEVNSEFGNVSTKLYKMVKKGITPMKGDENDNTKQMVKIANLQIDGQEIEYEVIHFETEKEAKFFMDTNSVVNPELYTFKKATPYSSSANLPTAVPIPLPMQSPLSGTNTAESSVHIPPIPIIPRTNAIPKTIPISQTAKDHREMLERNNKPTPLASLLDDANISKKLFAASEDENGLLLQQKQRPKARIAGGRRGTYDTHRRQMMRTITVSVQGDGDQEELIDVDVPVQEEEDLIPHTSFRVIRQKENIPGPVKVKDLYAKDKYNIPFLVLIPFFNEEPEDLFSTIASVHKNGQRLFNNNEKKTKHVIAATHCLIVLDGYNKASSHTLAWLRELFPGKPGNDPWEFLGELKANKNERSEVTNWFVDKADISDSKFQGKNKASKFPSPTWHAIEVYQWALKILNEETAVILLRNKIDGKQLFRLNIGVCVEMGIPLSWSIDLIKEIERITATNPGGDKLYEIAVLFQHTFHGDLHPMTIWKPGYKPAPIEAVSQKEFKKKFAKSDSPILPSEVNDRDSSRYIYDKSGCCENFNPLDREKPPKNTPVVTFVSLIVKCRNRQKHNSHWWAIQPDFGFVSQYSQSSFIWFTDCSTIFEKDCLLHMWNILKRSKKTGAVTGRQRVMNATQQDKKNEGFLSEYLRNCQRCDFELSFAATVGAFAIIGVLPVLPGPCGLFRSKIVRNGANTFYHSFLEMKEIGLIEANVMIAEDRILSVAPFFAINPDKDPNSKKTQYYKGIMTDIAPQATFYYEAENSIMSLVKQRRRWMNGTIASYIWFLYKKPKLICSYFNISFFKKCFLWYLFSTQVYGYFFVYLSPAIFIVAFKVAVEKLTIPFSINAGWWWYYVLGLYIAFSVMSSYKKVKDWTLYTAMLVGAIVQAITIISLALNIVTTYVPHKITKINPDGSNRTYFGTDVNFYDTATLGIVGFFMILPIVTSLIASPWSFVQVIRSGLHFLLFLPTLVGVMGVYSITNFSDFSWGNRDSNGSEEKLGSKKLVIAERGQFVGWFFLFLNILLVMTAPALYDLYYFFRPAVTGVLFVPPLTVFIISFIFFVYWRIKWCMCCCGLVSNRYMKTDREEQTISLQQYEDNYRLKKIPSATHDI